MNFEEKVENIKKIITRNSLPELRYFFKENSILSEDFNNFNEILIYTIESKKASVEILEYIINARKNKDLNFTIKLDGKYKTPLFEAVKNSAFDKADILIKNNANINYKSKHNHRNIYYYLYYNDLLTARNLRYILNNGSNIDRIELSRIIDSGDSDSVEAVYNYNYIKYNKNLILNLINLSKNKVAISHSSLKKIIKNQEDILKIDDALYERVYDKGLNDILRVLFKYDGSYKNKLYRRIITYDLLERTTETNDYNYVKKLLSLKPLNYKCMNYETILKKAIKGLSHPNNNRKKISKLLIDSFIYSSYDNKNDSNATLTNIFYENEYFNLIVNYAIKEGSMTAVKYLIENEEYKPNLDLNVCDINNEYPLITALYEKKNGILRYLVRHGADCNVRNSNGIPLLMLAMQNNNEEVIEFLLEQPNIYINDKDPNGYSAFMTAINQNNTYLTELILDYSNENDIVIDINEMDASGNYPIVKAVNDNNFDMVITLVEYGAENYLNMNLQDINENPLLHLAYKHGYLKMFKYLIQYLDINQVDGNGQSIIFFAAAENDIDMVNYLISNGADVNVRDYYDNTVIDYAIVNGNYELLEILVQKDNLLLNEYNARGETPLISLIRSKDFSEEKKDRIIRNFINKGCDIEKPDKKYNLSPLIHAIRSNKARITKTLISMGANLNRVNEKGYTYIRYGINYSMGDYKDYYSREIKKILFETEIYNIVDDKGLFFSEIKNDNVEKIKRLIPTVLDINMVNNDGNTLLHEAVFNKKPELVELLLEKGINKQIKNRHGDTANDINEKYNKKDHHEDFNRCYNKDDTFIYNEIHNLLQYYTDEFSD
ncbi:hypothetical protein PIROE2DRAFT_19457 [Piromyces sp. E2]|nr:hypothetical protein PIROE2DRAFT_19457 [Piromyces sp. E2]|eukprot:OUM70571.1 hypothetical protein PIROE2DRAFT_19457 [Piromyces sp. E2]